MITQSFGSLTQRAAIGALTGLLAAATALGVAQLAAGLTGPLGSPVVAVGGVAINVTPVPVKDFAIAHFGTHDKQVLVLGILVVLAIFAAVVGMLAMRRVVAGLAGLAVFAALGMAAAITRPAATALDVIPALVGAMAGAAALIMLCRAARSGRAVSSAPAAGTPSPDGRSADRPDRSDRSDRSADRPDRSDRSDRSADQPDRSANRPDRRRFLLLGAGAATAAAVSGWAGQQLLSRFNVTALRAAVRLPAPAIPAVPWPAAAQLPVPGITPFMTSNASFYRVDTDIVVPQVSPDQWQLRVHGMVTRELSLSFDDLLHRPLTEAAITLACVSNEVGGHLAGNARWLGAGLASLLREAGVRRGADQILSAATDGMTISTPLSAVLDNPGAMLAVGMNGQPLPAEHGFPARMMVPGLYGYVSGTKWVTDLKVTTFAAERAYWTQRGYAEQAPIKTMSRIDVPRPLQQIPAGRTAVAGVAWAPRRGIDAVEISADGGPWREATLAAVPGIDTWRQWVWHWDAAPGLHQLQVRATDGTGATQPARRVPIFPDGATGWDSTAVTVT